MKKTCITLQAILLTWFFLDMIGLSFGDKCIVTRSYQDDGIFFLIYAVTMVLFIAKENIGKWLVAGWTSLWLIIQFLCHEWYTIFDCGFMGTLEGKIKYFSGTLQWIKVEGKYIPDVYHTVLHILILLVIISTFLYIRRTKRIN